MPSEFSSNIRQIAAEIKLYEKTTATAIRKAARVAVTKAGEGTAKAIKDKAAAEGLEKAHDATGLRVSFSVRSGGAKITTKASKAPYARALEKGSRGSGGAFDRHPVFAKVGSAAYKNPKRWFDQPTKPFFYDTAKGRERINEEELIAAVDAAIRAAGWRG